MSETGVHAEKRKSRRRTLFLALLIAAVIILILLLRGCPAEGPFDYFRAKAEELDKDPDRALEFVRDKVVALDYRGDVKGALGALWDGAGSPEEKIALLDALWAHCEGGRSGAGLAEVAPDELAAGDQPADAAKTFQVTVTHRSWPEEGPPNDTKVFEGPIGSLVGNVHTISFTEAGATRIEIRAARTAKPIRVDVPAEVAIGESIRFEIERPGAEPLVVERELWRSDNRVGPAAAIAGDRHDFVVLPCRVSEWVREKEKLILEESGRKNAPEAEYYDGLLEFAAGSDELLADMEAEFGVRARFEPPRILILSTIGEEATAAHAIDLRQDYTSFMGEPGQGYVAAHVRGLLESGIEHEWLAKWTGADTRSAFEAFNRLRDDFPNRLDTRVRTIYRSLGALREHGGTGAVAVFRAKGATTVPVEARWTEAGIHVTGGEVQPAFAKALEEAEKPELSFDGGSLDQVFTDGGDAAAAIETVLLGSDGDPSLPPDYVLEAEIRTGVETVVVPSARFRFEWGEGDDTVRQSVQVTSTRRGLEYSFHMRRGLRTAKGTVAIDRAAADGATLHNPFYRTGFRKQKDATSFCVSKHVHAELAAGRVVPFELLAKYERTDDPEAPRRVEWSGELKPLGAGEVQVEVNGKTATLPVIRAGLEGDEAPMDELAILDDPRWPIGRADALSSIQTNVRGVLVDENGIGIGGAFVQAGTVEGGASCITWPDGRFRLPPPKEGESYGSIRLLVKQKALDETQEDEVPLDLSATGLDDVEVRVERLRNPVVWVAPDETEKLDPLAAKLSSQVMRHVRADLSAGRHIAIPARMIDDGLVGAISYYSYDPRIGHIVGVTEDGLHGTMANWYSYGKAAKKAAAAAKEGASDFGAASPLHAMRGANTAMFLFASYRLRHGNAEEVAERLLSEMEMWEERTNMFSQLDSATGTDAGGKLADALGAASGIGGINGDSAKASFYFGYIVATAFLNKKVD